MPKPRFCHYCHKEIRGLAYEDEEGSLYCDTDCMDSEMKCQP